MVPSQWCAHVTAKEPAKVAKTAESTYMGNQHPFRKSLMSIIVPPAILGPEMAVPIFVGAWHFLVLSAGKPPCP